MKSAPDSPAGGTAGVMHTPGPWTIEPKQARGNWIKDSTGDYIAMVCIREGNEAEEDANARLFLTAPALLAALTGVLAWYDANETERAQLTYDRFETARAALAKAASSQ